MAWKPEYIILIIISTLIDYSMSILMEKSSNKRRRKIYLLVSIITNLGLLIVFKYFNFLFDSVSALFANTDITSPVRSFSLLLPMGISFYTFQTLSYSIDVYRKKRKVERHLGYFALYVSYFPQLVAGPIERSDRLIPQLRQKNIFNYDRVKQGMQRMLWGVFQKIIIADTIAIVVETVYSSPKEHTGLSFVIATAIFAVQILCDFAGYTNIAIGCAQIMGIELMENFRQPYFAVSIRDFWSRWHISLSTWFRDYLYIPLGGNRVKKPRYYFNIMVTFLISGLWHGANWTYVFWGGLHGVYSIIEDILSSIRKAIGLKPLIKKPWLKRFVSTTFVVILVGFSWIFFRAENLNDAFYIVSHLIEGAGMWIRPSYIKVICEQINLDFMEVLLPLIFGMIVMIIMWIQKETGKNPYESFNKLPTIIRWIVYIAFTLAIIAQFVLSNNTSQFIYFQF
ncbi:MAG: MBOAT family protein [Clostridiales bacterium]|nr:MBOAT family protein [Clostridiales bacterium]